MVYTGGMKKMAEAAHGLEEHSTYGDYRTWPDEERWELIEGIAYSMSPAPMRRHQKLSGRLFIRIGVFLEGRSCEVYEAPFDVLLPEADETDDEVDTVVQPDIEVFCDKSKLTKRGARGAPDWAIEILSARSARKDFEAKHQLYQRHGVREYWIVDPDAAVIHAWRLGGDGLFGEEALYEDGEAAPSSVLEGLVIKTDELFADLD
jgi:Uma2 family endonuclease